MIKLLPVIEHTLGVYKIWYGFRDHFPKKARYTLGDKIDSMFLRALELTSAASFQSPEEKIPTLNKAIVAIDMLKFFLRVAWELKIFDDKKYEVLSVGVNETGRQLGAWNRGLIEKKTPRK